MINNISKFRDKLSQKQLCLGAGISLNDPAVVEALAPQVDFLWIDLEHNPIGMESLLSLLIAARAGGAPAIVRVPSSGRATLKRVLDSGAEGIIVPQVRSAAEVQQAVDAARYTPLGTRGWGPRRPSEYGHRSAEQTIREANESLFLAMQIENTDAIDALDEIVAIPGIDSLAVGPYDLSMSMGKIGQFDDPEVRAAIEKIIRTGHDAGLPVGFGDEAAAEAAVRWAEMGADWIQPGGDVAYLRMAADQLFAEVRKSVS